MTLGLELAEPLERGLCLPNDGDTVEQDGDEHDDNGEDDDDTWIGLVVDHLEMLISLLSPIRRRL